ncbi:hypothetical protein BaRGS_00015019 [Batillaria attramentaria]|uniref:Uncharacterized protein n=1 Tax=Batillaria attramentaria TaxID=370345 RepID=A0ABD0L3J4_9CAEN
MEFPTGDSFTLLANTKTHARETGPNFNPEHTDAILLHSTTLYREIPALGGCQNPVAVKADKCLWQQATAAEVAQQYVSLQT